MPKPTPVQAEILRLLRENPDVSLRLDYYNRPRWYPDDFLEGRDRGVTKTTFKILIRNGWINETSRDTIQDWVRGVFHKITDAGLEILELLSESDFRQIQNNPHEMTAKDIKGFLRDYREVGQHRPGTEPWIFLEEFAPFDRYRIDALAVAAWGSHGYRAVAYEIKINRSDYLAERRRPEKLHDALKIATQFYYVTPPSLLRLIEIPETFGLIEFNKLGRATVIRAASEIEPDMNTDARYVARLARKYARDTLVRFGVDLNDWTKLQERNGES